MIQLPYKWIPAESSVFQQGRNGASVKNIILHSTDGRCAGDIATLTGQDTDAGTHKVSVHWYVTRTGDIYHFVDDGDTAWHTGAVSDLVYDNRHTIGIEHEHYDGSEDWPDAQVNSSALVVAFLRQQYPGIGIAHHADIATPSGRKVDPVNWPSQRFWSAISAIAGETIEPVKVN